MRKYVVGFIIGAVFASAFPAYGAVSSMIGKKVQAENTVIVNGKVLDVKSVNIGGTTYAPNRAIANALGLDIKFENGQVTFESKEGEVDMVEEYLQSDLYKLELQLREISLKIATLENERGNATPERVDEINKEIIELTEQAKPIQAKIAELEAQQ